MILQWFLWSLQEATTLLQTNVLQRLLATNNLVLLVSLILGLIMQLVLLTKVTKLLSIGMSMLLNKFLDVSHEKKLNKIIFAMCTCYESDECEWVVNWLWWGWCKFGKFCLWWVRAVIHAIDYHFSFKFLAEFNNCKTLLYFVANAQRF